jgi:hypothetical protein
MKNTAFGKQFPGVTILGRNIHDHIVGEHADGSKSIIKCNGDNYTVLKEVPPLVAKKTTKKTKPVRLNAGGDSDKFWAEVNRLMDKDPKLSQQKARKAVAEKRPDIATDVPDKRLAQTNPFSHKLMAATETLVAGGATRTEAKRQLVQTQPDLVRAGEGRTPVERHAGALGVYLNQGLSLDEAMIRANRDLPADAQALALNAL